VRDTFADFSGHLYERDAVRVHVAEARNFVARSRARYDLIQLALIDSFSAASAGVYALNESTLYTVEAFQSFLAHLAPGGLLAVTRWLKLPPRDALKLAATAREALHRMGLDDAGERMALIRGWKTTTLIVKHGRLDSTDIAALRGFATARGFDLAWHPGLRREDANRFNRLAAPLFHDGAVALLGPQRQGFIDAYKFALEPATDDRPYFFHSFKWAALPELIRLPASGGVAFVEWGYIVLVATLAQAVAASAILILVPLWAGRVGRGAGVVPWGRARLALYFVALGLGFLFVEIAFIQRFVLFLGHPLYAIAVVLAAFLVFAGLGSGASAGLERWLRARSALGALELAVAAIAILSIAYIFGLPMLFRGLMALPDAAKIALSLVLVAPLAFFMGMPFPLVLARVRMRARDFVPWAWGINGCASVVSAIVATLLTMGFGSRAVVMIAAVLYLLAALVARRPGVDSEQSGAVGR
jgi:hypothetical protein